MDLSGVIFVVLAIVWAVYLIPKALRQGDQVARTRSIDRFSSGTRVVARREPVSPRDARLVVPSSGPAVAPAAPPEAPARVEPRRSRGPAGARRTASAAAARRRRRILAALLVCGLVTAAVAYLGYLPRWSVAVPGGLTVAYLLVCRTQVRRHRTVRRPVATARPVAVEETLKVAPVVAAPAEPAPAVPDHAREAGPDVLPDVTPDAAPPAYPDSDPAGHAGGDLWDPLPVTLPTYVTKPKARRTVRTIDLGEPGTWTSGHTPEGAEIAARATDPDSSHDEPAAGGRRAVGG